MYLLEKIMELYYDTDSVVRNSGMKLFFNIAENLSPEEIKNRCVKLFLDQIQSQNEESKLAMSYVCGRVYNLVYLYNYQIHMYLTDKQQNQFLQIYKEYAKNKNTEIRHNFVYNFPAILSISIKKFDFFEQYYQLCCLDQSEQVQRCVLSSFHEVVLLAEHTDFHIKQMITYMHSQNQAILEILVNKFSLIVNAFQSNVTLICMLSQQQTQFALPSLELLVQLHNKWSLQSDFLEQLLDCQQIFTDFDAFMTALFNCISKGIPGTRKLCAQNIAKYLSGSTNLVKRQNCINQIYETFYKSNSCFNRITYLDIVESFSHLISRKLFKQLGFFDSLSYAQDPVVNVRIRLIKVLIVLNESLPQIKVKIEHDDLITQELFNEAVQNCVKSDTRSFQQVIRQTKEELLKLYDEEEMSRLDQQMQAVEDIIYQADLKQRQFQLDDLDSNMSDYKYRKKYPLSKTKVHSNIGLQSQTVLGRKEKLQLLLLIFRSAGGLLFKKTVVDMEGNKSPLLETQQKKSRMLPKSMCDVKKQFKLPSIKK
ncbi:hypothetical protein FGO68_gene16990 [Halteria grandinella]|uniref:Uncharacterized protein n=1 Tax=Halteria grandinella TaxID=5974 RepID=A0A8J8SX56_HALGN|nr:hypothetical protein FGO68_gene16990 [Halteria grandinella]